MDFQKVLNTVIDELDFLDLSDEAIKELKDSKVLRLVAAAPYICKAKDAERRSIQDVLSMILASKNRRFNSMPDDFGYDIWKRFKFIMNYRGRGRLKKAIKRRLILASLTDHKEDQREDDGVKYNIFLHDFKRAEKLLNKYKNNQIKHYEIDYILPVKSAMRGWWRG